MSRHKGFKTSTPEIEDRLNNHSSNYREYLALIFRIHNAQMAYMEFPSKETSRELQKSLTAIKRSSLAMYNDLTEIRQLLRAEDKRRWRAHAEELERLKYVQVFKEEKKNDND
jgi:nitrate reductase assembly molybdenum cofactor insertion protein NarJ